MENFGKSPALNPGIVNYKRKRRQQRWRYALLTLSLLCVDWLVSSTYCILRDLIGSDKPKLDSLHIFFRKILSETIQINPKLDSFKKLKDNSVAGNAGLTDCYIIKDGKLSTRYAVHFKNLKYILIS